MTQLTDLLNKGYNVMISEMVEPDKVVAFDEPNGRRTIVFHPLNYSYVSLDDPFRAHKQNMDWIQENVIEKAYQRALKNIDEMTDDFNASWEPRTIVFLPNTRVEENPDGSFSFYAEPVYEDRDANGYAIIDEPAAMSIDDIFNKGEFPQVEPSFDDILYGRNLGYVKADPGEPLTEFEPYARHARKRRK